MSVKRPDLVLGGALLVCLPMVPGVVSGEISTSAALIRFLIALVVCWTFESVLSSVFKKYTEQSRRQEVLRLIEMARQKAKEDQAMAEKRSIN